MGSRIMDGEEFFAGIGDTVSSSNLNDLIRESGLHIWPEGVTSINGSGIAQGGDVVHTESLNLTHNISNESKPQEEQNNEVVSNFDITVVIEQRMVRFRYDSELNNRNFGKEVLAKILVHGVKGKVRVRIHAVDDKKMKAHPFCLIGDKCLDGVYIEDHQVTPERNECICKATPRIPKQKDHEMELLKRKAAIKDGNRFPFITEEMAKDDYWTNNKNIKESKEILLMVEVVVLGDDNQPLPLYRFKLSEPINNAKDGKKFEVHAVSPTTSSVLGSSNDPHYIILTADSYSPNESDIEVIFTDDGTWTCTAVHVKVIRNAIEFCFPGYSNPLSMEKTIYVSVFDKKKKLRTAKKELILRPTDNDIIEHKRKKAFSSFTLPPYMENIKTEERASCSASAPRKKHHLKKRGGTQNKTIGEAIDLRGMEESGILSLNVESPFNMSDASQSSNSSFNQPFSGVTEEPSSSLNATVPNTIPTALLIPSGSRDMEIKATMFGTPIPTAETSLQNQLTLNNIAVSQQSTNLGNFFNQATSINVSESNQNGLFNLFSSNSAMESTQTASSANTTNNVFDMSQSQAPSLNSLNSAQIQELFKLIVEMQQGNMSGLDSNQLSQNQTNNSTYDPHDIRIEDLADFDQTDVEVDCADVTSTTETTEDCEDCGKEVEKVSKKEGKQEEKGKNYTKVERKISETVIKSQKTHADTKDSISNKKTNKDSSNTNLEPEKDSSKALSKKHTTSENTDTIQSAIVTSNVDSDVEEG